MPQHNVPFETTGVGTLPGPDGGVQIDTSGAAEQPRIGPANLSELIQQGGSRARGRTSAPFTLAEVRSDRFDATTGTLSPEGASQPFILAGEGL